MSRLWYLATPYSKFEAGIEAAFIEAAEQAALLVAEGVAVFCPIAHSHPIAIHGGLDPYDHELWIPADRPLMDAAFGLIVCAMPGWKTSVGIGLEIKEFRRAGKPIIKMTPGVAPVELIRRKEAAGEGGR